MTKGKRDSTEELRNLTQAFVDDLVARRNEEILQEAIEDGNAEAIIARTRGLVRRVLDTSGKAKMAAARAAVRDRPRRTALIVSLPLAEKKALLEHVVARSTSLPERITLAARKGNDMSEADLNGVLEDLRDLGMIDDQGRPK